MVILMVLLLILLIRDMIKNQDHDQYNMLGGYGNNDDGDYRSNSLNLGLSIGNALCEKSDECLADQPNGMV